MAAGTAGRGLRRLVVLGVAVAILVVVTVAIVSKMGHGSRISRTAFDQSVFVACPRAVTIRDVFRTAESGRYIDTGSISNPTELIRRYRLKEPVATAAFTEWIAWKYPPIGWPTSRRFDDARTSYGRTVGKRAHRLDITVFREASGSAVQQYELIYAIS
jgi:hypothetical protein